MINLRRTILHRSKPVAEWWGHQHLPYTHKLVTGKHYYSLLPSLQTGMIFLTRIDGELSNLLIPGKYTHAAIYHAKEEGIEYVIEATSKGVNKVDLVTFMTTKDHIAVLVPSFSPPPLMSHAAAIAAMQIGKPYDYAFEFSVSQNNSFYCSELCWFAYDSTCREFNVPNPFTPRVRMGTEMITPQDFYNANTKFRSIWESELVR